MVCLDQLERSCQDEYSNGTSFRRPFRPQHWTYGTYERFKPRKQFIRDKNDV